tara:strand:+ start:369 stop:527 length:159 start_codon:yes stop_codon:yes gene_type:complete
MPDGTGASKKPQFFENSYPTHIYTINAAIRDSDTGDAKIPRKSDIDERRIVS